MDQNIGNLIKHFVDQHFYEIRNSYESSPNTEIVTREIPKLIQSRLNLDSNFKVCGSVGAGNWSEIPWIAVLDKSITTSTTEGYYVVILFSKDLKAIYVALALGWTQFKEEYGGKEGKQRIRSISEHYAGKILDSPPGFKSGVINLAAEKTLGKGYEKGAILSKKYTIGAFSDEELLSDLTEIIRTYKDLKNTVGSSIFNLNIEEIEEVEDLNNFKKEVALASLEEDPAEALLKLTKLAAGEPSKVRERLCREIVRNRKFAEFVKERSDFVCELCGRKPFLQSNGKPYAEADHIVPLGGKTKGGDHPDNMRCLCSQCHAVVTHGSDEEIKNLFI